MILSTAVVVSVLSLLSCSRALTLNARQDDCAFGCPDTDVDGNDFSTFSVNDNGTISCSYVGDPGNSCTYNITTGVVTDDSGACLEATQECSARRRREFKQAVARREKDDGSPKKWGPSPSPSVTWKPHGTPSSHPKRDEPSPASDKDYPSWSSSKPSPSPYPSHTGKGDHYSRSSSKSSKPYPSPSHTEKGDYPSWSSSKPSPSPYPSHTGKGDYYSRSSSKPSPSPYPSHTGKGDYHSWSSSKSKPPSSPSPTWKRDYPSSSKPRPSPSPSPTGKPEPQPTKQIDYTCPQKDLAKNPLTNEATQDYSLICSYYSPDCKSCSFCKYSTRTGLLLEDKDDGKCPQAATPARQWGRRYI